MRSLRWIVLGVLALWVGQACAETQSVSYSTWRISGKTVTLRFLLPVREAHRLIGPDVPVGTVKRLAEYLLDSVTVRSASGPCEVLDQGYDLGKVDLLSVGPDLYGFEIFFRCDDPRQVVLQDAALFPRIPEHLHIAQLHRDGGALEHVFTATNRQWQVPDNGTPTRPDVALYLRLGVEQVLHNADRLCLMLGLVLIVRRWRDLAYTMVALALGYGASVAVSQVGWIASATAGVQAFVGLLVALAALAVIVSRTDARRAVVGVWIGLLLLAALVAASMGRTVTAWMLLGGALLSAGFSAAAPRGETAPIVAPLLAALLGFVDGFLWADAIQPALLPSPVERGMLAGVDLGAWLIETIVAALLMGAFLFLRTRGIERTRAWVIDASAAGLAGFGTFWLASRLLT